MSKEVSELKVALLQAKADRARKPVLRNEYRENMTPNTVRGLPAPTILSMLENIMLENTTWAECRCASS